MGIKAPYPPSPYPPKGPYELEAATRWKRAHASWRSMAQPPALGLGASFRGSFKGSINPEP